MATNWGIFDTEDEVWIGDERGPRLFTEEDIARVAAQMTDVMLGQKPGRCRAREFGGQPVRLRDEKKTRMGPGEALDGLESGKYI